jgi:hypothetical protein
MYLKIGDRVRLIDDVVSSFYDREEIYVSGTKGSIAVILSPEQFLLCDPYKQIYDHAEILKMIVEMKWYPIRYEKIAPLLLTSSSSFEVIDQCREGSVGLVSVCILEKLDDDVS